MAWLDFRYRFSNALLVGIGILLCGSLSLAKPTYALLPLGALIFYVLYVQTPPVAIVLTLAASPLLDQATLRPLHGFGFDLASVVRGSALLFMWIAILTRFNKPLLARKGLLIASATVLIGFLVSLPFSIDVTMSIKEMSGVAYWITFYLYVTLALDAFPTGRFVQWGLLAAGAVILVTLAPYELGHVYQPYTNGAWSIYGRYNSGPFNLAVSVAFLLPMLVILQTARQRVAYLVLFPALLYILGNTYVRTAAVIVVLFVFYYLLQSRRTRWAVLGAGSFLLMVVLSSKSFGQGWLARLQQGHTLNGFASGRITLYLGSLHAFAGFHWSRKMIGMGFGNARLVLLHAIGWQVIPQNDFLDALLGAGVLGLVGLIVYLVGVVQEIWKFRDGPLSRFGLFVFLAVLVTASINGIFTGESTAMVFAMSLIAVSHARPVTQLSST